MRPQITMNVATILLAFVAASGPVGAQSIVCPADGPANVTLAAKEIRRYVYLRTGELLKINSGLPDSGPRIHLAVDRGLAPQQYRLKTTGPDLTISGGSDVAVLYGCYAFAEKLGVRFYLHGDVIPDDRIRFELPQLDETRQPVFETRGIQPFHDFQEGPDWWNQDDWLAYVGQLAKLRMNFIGLHCYPQGGVGPEPLVWIGRPQDCDDQGQVKSSYPSQWASTERGGMWGSASVKTGDFAGGASRLFATDAYAPEVMAGMIPRPATPEQCNELFNRVGAQMRVVFDSARTRGVKTCIGTETPLTIPNSVRERSSDAKTLYAGMFKRIAAACPVDYYWLWTPENWTWTGNNPKQFEATKMDIQAALAALEDLGNPFTLATSGWVLGPAHDRAALDEFLPKTSPMSCINREVGHTGVEPAFANITGRPKWAIPWMENDPNMVGPQPWVARMRHDAVDARRYGCTGLLGIHWRTKALTMNIAALAAASWDQSWVPAGFDTTPVKPSKGGEGALGGQVVAFQEPVAGTGVSAIYQNVRYDLDGYRLAVPDGTYTVTLQFNEPHYTAPGKRVFGAKIQGRQVVANLDVFARVGRNQALDLRYPDIVVTDGSLRIDFTREVEFPCIAGLVIEGTTKGVNQLAGEVITRRINCGGPAVAGYEADRVSGATAPPSPRNRAMPVADFYQDFASANFGPGVAEAAGGMMAKADGLNMPAASDWKNGPGNLVPNPAPWSEVKKRYAFVDEFATLRPLVKGPGNLERFDYWLNTWRGAAAMAEACCVRGQLDRVMAARESQTAVGIRAELARAWERLMALQTAIVSTPGELGTIANLEQHTRKQSGFVEGHDAALTVGSGKPLPAACAVSGSYSGPERLIVPTVRGSVTPGEALQLAIIALASSPVESVTVHFRPLGSGGWQSMAAKNLGRAVWQAKFPDATEDFEYYVTAGNRLIWPATAPQTNQTVITCGK